MNEEVLELVLKYPELADKLTPKYRKELLVLYYEKNLADGDTSYARIADVYNRAKLFKVSAVNQAMREIFNLKADNINMQISYAKKKGLIERSIKTNHSKGYRQKNYVAK